MGETAPKLIACLSPRDAINELYGLICKLRLPEGDRRLGCYQNPTVRLFGITHSGGMIWVTDALNLTIGRYVIGMNMECATIISRTRPYFDKDIPGLVTEVSREICRHLVFITADAYLKRIRDGACL